MYERGRAHPLDRPVARLVAVSIALAGIAVLAVIHRADLGLLISGPGARAPSPLERCIAEHHATIDKGVTDGVFGAEQAGLFKQRAEAICRSTVPQ